LYGGEKNYFHAPNEIDYIAPSRFQAQSEWMKKRVSKMSGIVFLCRYGLHVVKHEQNIHAA
jgi:hypothetical protein